MNRKVLVPLLVVAMIVALPSCETWSRQEKGAAIGAGTGAGLGALIGAASGSWAWGMVIGAAGGALTGYVIADATAPDEKRPPAGTEAARKRAQADEYLDKAARAQNMDDSEYFLTQSINAYPTATAYNNLGLVHLQRGDRPRAEQMWQKALEIDPGNEAAKKNLARSQTG